MQRGAERRAKKLEVDIMDYEERFKNFDTDLCTRDVLQDRLKCDKDRVSGVPGNPQQHRNVKQLHVTPLADLFNQTSSQLLWEAPGHTAINAERLLIQIPNTVYSQVLIHTAECTGAM